MTTASPARPPNPANRAFAVDLARAFGGAIVFALPMLMTNEMWVLGASMPPLRLGLLLMLNVPLLVGLSHFVGFEDTFCWQDDLVDAFVAYAVGFLAAAPVLLMFGVITAASPPEEIAGKVALQAVAGSIGALLTQAEFRAVDGRWRKEVRGDTYSGELFFMCVGAVFLTLNIAPTQEVLVISYQMGPWHTLSLALVSLTLMHVFVYSVEFRGQSLVPEGTSGWSVFLRYTLVGYALCIATCAYALWTFGRCEGFSYEMINVTIVLAFPAAIGAAVARLVL